MTDIETQWEWWQSALDGASPEVTIGKVESGYYRLRSRDAVAFWREDDGLHCWLNGKDRRGCEDELAERYFAWCCRRPITYEVHQAFLDTGQWPEDIGAEVDAAKAALPDDQSPGMGDNARKPEEEVLDEIDTLDRAFADWLKSIGGKIATEEHDAKAETFKTRFMAIEKRAFDGHKDEKAPWLEGGRLVDERWRAPKAKAEAGKKTVGAALTPYRIERDRLRQEEARKAREEVARAAAVATQNNEPPPPSVAAPVRQMKSGLRTHTVVEINDLRLVVDAIMSMRERPTEFVETVRLIVGRMLHAKVAVPGARLVEEKRA